MKNKGVFYNLCQFGLKGGGSAHRLDLRAFPGFALPSLNMSRSRKNAARLF